MKRGEARRARKDPAASTPFPHMLKSLTRINDVSRHFIHAVNADSPNKAILQAAVYGSKTLNRIVNPWDKTPQLNDVTITEVTKFDDRINIFYDKIKSRHYFLVNKTIDYMNWRYCDKRGGNLKVWIAEKNDEIVGYLVLKTNNINADYPEGYIMDFLALNDRNDVADNLVKFAVDYFDDREINVIWAEVIGGHPYERILGKYGLIDTQKKSNLNYRVIKFGDDFDKFANASPEKIHYMFGEGDAI